MSQVIQQSDAFSCLAAWGSVTTSSFQHEMLDAAFQMSNTADSMDPHVRYTVRYIFMSITETAYDHVLLPFSPTFYCHTTTVITGG